MIKFNPNNRGAVPILFKKKPVLMLLEKPVPIEKPVVILLEKLVPIEKPVVILLEKQVPV